MAQQGKVAEEEQERQRGILVGRDENGQQSHGKIGEKAPVAAGFQYHDIDKGARQHRQDQVEHGENAGEKHTGNAECSDNAAEGNMIAERLRRFFVLTHNKIPRFCGFLS